MEIKQIFMIAADVNQTELETMTKISKQLILGWIVPAGFGFGTGMLFLGYCMQ